MRIIDPNRAMPQSRVIEAILRAFCCVYVDQDFNLIVKARIQHPLNLVNSAVHASHIRTIRVHSPVSDRKSDPLHSALCQSLDVGRIVPVTPVVTHPFVRVVRILQFFATLGHDFAECIRIKRNIALFLVKKRVEQRRCDPWLEDEPPADVDSLDGRTLHLADPKECHDRHESKRDSNGLFHI